MIADIIIHLRGQPDWSFDLFSEETDTLKILQIQLEKERQALEHHESAANLIPPGPHENALRELAGEEKKHIRSINQIIQTLKAESSPG